MTYADTGRLTRLLGNPSTSQVNAADVTQAAAYGDAWVNTITGITWQTSDVSYAAIQSASELRGAAYLLRYFWRQYDKADAFDKDAENILDWVIKNSGSITTSNSTGYRSWPANSQASPYVSNSQMFTNTDGSNTDPGAI